MYWYRVVLIGTRIICTGTEYVVVQAVYLPVKSCLLWYKDFKNCYNGCVVDKYTRVGCTVVITPTWGEGMLMHFERKILTKRRDNRRKGKLEGSRKYLGKICTKWGKGNKRKGKKWG